MKALTYLTCLTLVLSPVAWAHCPAHQLADAQTKAAAEKKDVLLVFLGEDAISKKVKEETLANAEFKKGAEKHFVTHVIEFTKDPKDTNADLLTLKEKYKVNRLPVIIQVDPLGRPYGFANFRAQKPDAVLASLQKNIETRVKRDAAFEKALKETGVNRAKAIIEGLEVMPQFVLRDFYIMELADISKADPKGETGFIAKIEKAEALDQEQKRYQQLFKEEKRDQIVKLSQMESSKMKGEDAQRVAMYGIQALASQKKYDEAKKAIEAMAKIDPESSFGKSAERYVSVVERMKERNERKASAPKGGPIKKKRVSGPIVSKPVAIVTDIKKLYEESKSIDAEAMKAQEQHAQLAIAHKEKDSRIAKLENELKALKEGNAKSATDLKQSLEAAERLSKKSRMMKEVIENHEAMERRKRDISELEKRAAKLAAESEKLRKKTGVVKKKEGVVKRATDPKKADDVKKKK